MESESPRYELDTTQLDQALAILRKERETHLPSRRQKRAYGLFTVCVYGFFFTFVFSLLLAFRMGASEIDPSSKGAVVIAVSFVVLVVLFVIFGVLTPIMFLINLPLMRKLRRQLRLVRRLGLSQVFREPWQAESRKQRFRNILALIAAIFGVLILVGFIGLLSERMASAANISDVPWFLVPMLFLIVVALAIISFVVMRRDKQRLEVVARLQSSLAGYKDAAEPGEGKRIHIPSEQYVQIAQIERAQISRDREESIAASLKEPDVSYYSVQKSRSLREVLARLDPGTRFAVEDQIDKLTVEPRPRGVTNDPKTDTWRLRVPETQVEIGLAIDDDDRRIKILSLQLIADDGPSGSEDGDSRHD